MWDVFKSILFFVAMFMTIRAVFFRFSDRVLWFVIDHFDEQYQNLRELFTRRRRRKEHGF